MSRKSICWFVAVLTAVIMSGSLAFAAAHPNNGHHRVKTQHVLLISLDGFHEFDFERYIANHPDSALADLSARGIRYTNAISTRPSDSFPGSLAMVTGGSPSSTGVLYDVTWDDNLSAPGSDCSTRGTVVTYKENVDVNINDINTSINPALLPRDPDNGCAPVFPHSYLKVNTIFEVIKANGGRTAYADKHPSYDLYNGPSGTGVDDLYTPEINANGANNLLGPTQANDELKVQAILHQIEGFDHTGAVNVGVPTIFGMDFQAPNVGQKVAGYTNANGDLSTDLAASYDYVDGALGRMVAELRRQGLLDSTLIIVTSKHANGPVNPALRTAVSATPITTLIESVQAGLTAQVTVDTAALIWLKDHSKAPQVAAVLKANASTIAAETILSGDDINGELDVIENRRPDIIVNPRAGVIYTKATKKVEHGGFHDEDIHVPLLISQPGIDARMNITPVELKQIAPTILEALGIGAMELQAVQLERTKRLPGFELGDTK
jgi:predicted AlkP superfamily pyrophosphatase or phosphodiesterase